MRLLTLLTIAELTLGGAGLVASVVLMGSTSRLARLASGITTAVDSVYTAEQAERALLLHNRESALYLITKRQEHLHLRDQARRDLESALKELSNFSESQRERHALEKAVTNAEAYLRERDQLEAEGNSADAIFTATASSLDGTQGWLETLVQINYEQAQNLQKQAKSTDALGDLVGASASAAVMLILAGVFFLLHRGLKRPLIHLIREVETLETGKLSTITVAGPAELQEVATVLNHLIDRLRQQRESQLRFLAGIAHDLRTPLNAIKLSVQYMATGEVDEDQRSTLLAVDRQVLQLDRQVGDLLDTTRVEAGHLELKVSEQNLTELVESSVKIFSGVSPRHPIRLSAPDCPVLCDCDPLRIGQVMNNLLSNAIKYSPSGGEIRVTVSLHESTACVGITDQGIGIAAEDLTGIFEPFRRTASTREAIPGVGLGLSVAKRIIEAHGGTIRVTSTRGVGSTFTLQLPRKVSQDA